MAMTGHMIGTRASVALAAIAALGVLCATSASATDRDRGGRDRGGFVQPCSLDGVNPIQHPEIFGNAATAASYGFVQTADHTWHVRADCRR
jgi:hypothetical protein